MEPQALGCAIVCFSLHLIPAWGGAADGYTIQNVATMRDGKVKGSAVWGRMEKTVKTTVGRGRTQAREGGGGMREVPGSSF